MLLGAIVGTITWAFGTTENWNLTSPVQGLRVDNEYTSVRYTVALALVTLAATFLGGIIGGLLGSGWHRKLERRTEAEHHERRVGERREEARDVDLRSREETAEREHATAAARAREAAREQRGGETPPPQDRTTRS